MNSLFKLKSIVCLLSFLSLAQCRNDELAVIQTYSPIQNPVFALIYYTLPGVLTTGSGGTSGTSSSLPRGFKSSGGSLFAVGSSASLYESTDGSTFTKKTFTLPNCTATPGSSSGDYTECNVVSVAKFGSTIYAIGIKQVGVKNATNSSLTTVTEQKFYFASGATLNDLSFTEISDSNLSSTSYLSSSILPSSASSNGFVFGFGVSSSSHKYCGTANNGSSWVCQSASVTGSSPGMVELLNGTLVADIYYRWNGSGFTNAITSNQGTKGSAIYASGRTLYTSGGAIRYTTTDPSAWTGASVSGETTATQTGGPTGSYNWIGSFSGTLKAIGSSSSSNPTTYTAHTSSDNGANWSNQTTISLPSGLSPSNNIGSISNTVFVYAQSSSGTFTQKYFKSTDFTNWTEVTP